MRLIVTVLVAMVTAGCSSHPRRDSQWETEPTATRASVPYDPSRSQELVLHALRFIGVPYRYGGDSPEAGFDCSGLVWRVYQQAAGIPLPRDTHAISQVGEAIAREELQPGDLVFFNTLHRPFSHVGIYLGEERFIHAPSQGGAVEIARISERYWRQRFDGARRIHY